MASQVLGDQRRLWIYTPPGYSAASGPHDLLVFADGSLLIGSLAATTTLDTPASGGPARSNGGGLPGYGPSAHARP